MANANRPKGLSPIQNGDGSPWNQQANLYYIATDASNTYAVGDVVMLAAGTDADGVPTVTKWFGSVGGNTTSYATINAGGVATLPLGVIVGFRQVDPGVSLVGTSLALEKVYMNKSAGARYAYVVDDPNVIFEVQGDSTVWATSNGSNNCALSVMQDATASLSQSSPYSNSVATAPATTLSLPFQILGFVQRADNAIGAYSNLRVRFNIHSNIGTTNGRTGV